MAALLIVVPSGGQAFIPTIGGSGAEDSFLGAVLIRQTSSKSVY